METTSRRGFMAVLVGIAATLALPVKALRKRETEYVEQAGRETSCDCQDFCGCEDHAVSFTALPHPELLRIVESHGEGRYTATTLTHGKGKEVICTLYNQFHVDDLIWSLSVGQIIAAWPTDAEKANGRTVYVTNYYPALSCPNIVSTP